MALDANFFQSQIKKLSEAFPGKNFDQARIGMIWSFCHDLANEQFSFIANHFIKTRSATRPPLPADFDEAARLEIKNAFSRDVEGAAAAMNTPWPTGLKSFLEKNYPGCKTINDAMSVERLKIQVKKASGEQWP